MKILKTILFSLLLISTFSVYSQNLDILRNAADSLYKNQKYAEVIPIYQKLINNSSKDQVLYQKLSYSFLYNNQVDSAFNTIQKAFTISDTNADNYSTLAEIYFYKNDLDSSFNSIQNAIILQPDSVSYLLKKGAIQLAMDKTQNSIFTFRQALKKDPDNIKAYESLIKIFKLYQSFDSAIYYLDNLISLKNSPDYIIQKADIQYEQSKFSDAIITINDGLKIFTDNAELIKTKANMYIDNGQYYEAVKTLNPYMKSYDADYYYYYILSHYYIGNYDSASIYISIAKKNDPKADIFYFLDGYICNKNKDYYNAYLNFRAAYQINPSEDDYYTYLCTAKNMINTDTNVFDKELKLKGISPYNILKTAKQNLKSNSIYYYEKLLTKFKIDPTSLSIDEYFMLYITNAVQKEYSGYQNIDERISNAYSQKDYKYTIELAKLYVIDYPVSPYAYFIIANSYFFLQDYENTLYYLSIYYGFINAILSSGNGETPKSAYIVNSIMDEYLIFKALNLQSAGQGLVKDKNSYFDILYYYNEKDNSKVKIYFNIDLFYKK